VNSRSYFKHLVGFLTLAGFAAFPWVGVPAAIASSFWALWANGRRATDIRVPRWAVKLAGTAHLSLCTVLQVSALYELYNYKQDDLYGVFSILIVLLPGIACIAYVYMFFPDGIPRKS